MVRPERRVLAGAALLNFAVSPLFLWDAFSASLSRALHVSTPSLSVVYSVGLAAFTCGVLVGGRLADVIAPRSLARITCGGVVVGLGLAAVAPSLWVLVLGFGVVLGTTTGLGYATAVQVAGTASTKRGASVALVVSAYAAGAVVLAPVVDILLTVLGRPGMFATLAAMLGALVASSSILLPKTRPRTRATSSALAVAGLYPYRLPIFALWVMFLLGSAPALVVFGQAGKFAHAPELTTLAVALLNAGNFIGRLIAGPLSDRVGHTPSLHIAAAALVGACLALILANDPGVALGALLVLGLQYGAVSVLTPVAVAIPVPAHQFGTAYGIVFSGWGVVGLFGPVAAAWLAISTSYSAAAGVLLGVAVLFWGTVIWVSTVSTDAAGYAA